MFRLTMIVLWALCVIVFVEMCPAGDATDSAVAISGDRSAGPHAVKAGQTSTKAFPGLAPGFQLQDQYNIAHRHIFPTDRPRIVLFADRHVINHVAKWYNPIAKRYIGPGALESGRYRDEQERYDPPEKDVSIVGVAALHDLPVIWKPLVRWALRHYVRRAVLLDWKDDVARAYGFAPGMVNVYVLAPDGKLLLHVHGRDPEGQLECVFRAVDTCIAKNRDNAEEAIQEVS